MRELRKLAEDVRSALHVFESLTATPTIASTAALSKARLALVQAVNIYIAHFGTYVERLGTDPCRRQWELEHAQLVDLRRDYSEHITRFSVATVGQAWPAYQASSKRLMASMRRHLDQVMSWVPLG